ncbi:NADP-dependent oxidoreductase [Catellatospora sp. NPDC049133]|jgi:NADPH:quinone reductase-like Zn-dependent oxidoreductase|uniref:NADP-dependent oxidoreductase n=1 Tax=Catellatospora sp. NPDC049133 TaxID=3155499 RepID=UPI00340ED247
MSSGQAAMRAVGLTEYGGPEVLRVVDIPRPQAGPGQVRVRVRAAAVNPADTLLRAGYIANLMRELTPPYIPGQDIAGTVDQIGPGADARLRIGDRVMAMVIPIRPDGGGYAEHVVLDADWVTPAPAGTSHAEAATLPLNGLTALLTLDELGLPAGASLAVTGAAGALGGYLVQLAKHRGLRVLADALPADVPLVSKLGADEVVARGDGVAARLAQAAGGPVDAVADAAVIGDALFEAVRDGGAFAQFRGSGEPGGGLHTPQRPITVHPVFVPDYGGRADKLDELRLLAEAGVLTPRVAQVLPPEQAPLAHRLLEVGGVRGRLVLAF